MIRETEDRRMAVFASLLKGLLALDLQPGETVTVLGEGEETAAAERIIRTIFDARLVEDGADLLIEATGEPLKWQVNLERVRDSGRVLLLLEPRRGTADFDFYPQVHRRSLTLAVQKIFEDGEWFGFAKKHARVLAPLISGAPDEAIKSIVERLRTTENFVLRN